MRLLILLVFLLLDCSHSSKSPDWKWEKEEDTPQPEKVDPHPEIIKAGWNNVSEKYSSLPEGIQIYSSPESIFGIKTIAYIALADPQKILWDVESISDPSLRGTTEPLQTPSQFYGKNSAPVIINGGYFYVDGGKRYSASVAVSGSKTYGVNINYASLDWKTMYYPTRGVFYENEGSAPTVGWTYYSSRTHHYLYDVPAKNSWSKSPLQKPDASFPSDASAFSPLTAIGGGPVLIKDGESVNTWEEELFYGDSSDDKMPKERHPRTAIGYTEDGFILLFVCEGRGMTPGVSGLSFEEEAKVLKSLGCRDALNLDGGGSTCMLVEGKETVLVSDGNQRAVASVVTLKSR